ncbi:MAG: hypothetical protein WCJ30_03370 [Deltaproteobacteria bacterium]
MTSAVRRLGISLTIVAIVACAAPQRREAPALVPLPESRALEVIRSGFEEAHVQPELHRVLHLRENHEMEVDYATVGHRHGVEFLQAQDRADFGAVLPQRRVQGSLLTVVGVGDDATFDVLLLDDGEFMYQPDPAFTSAGQPTLIEVEDRLRRAVVDYLTYLQHHGEL